MVKKIIRRIILFSGYEIGRRKPNPAFTPVVPGEGVENETMNPYRDYDYGREGFEAVRLTSSHSMLPRINLFLLFEQAVYCEKKGIEGAFVECGVWKGGAVGIMAKANLDFGSGRRDLHLFDAFDDICAPDAAVDGKRALEDMKRYAGVVDGDQMKGQLEPMKGMYDSMGGHGTIDACRELLEDRIGYPSGSVHYHKGWFQDTLPVDAGQIDKIAILRLDGDWYDSIRICLHYLFDKVVRGGLIVIDDYGLYEGCTRAVDEFLGSRDIRTFLSYSSPGCRFFVKN